MDMDNSAIGLGEWVTCRPLGGEEQVGIVTAYHVTNNVRYLTITLISRIAIMRDGTGEMFTTVMRREKAVERLNAATARRGVARALGVCA